MYATRVITAADESMREWAKRCVASAKQNRYKSTIYNLHNSKGWSSEGELEVGSDGFSPCLFKPRIIRDALKRSSPVIYLDADCVMQCSLDAVLTGDYDVGVTVRREPEVHPKAGTVNTGVLVFYSTPASRDLLVMWTAWAAMRRSEQQALNDILKRDLPWLRVKELPGVQFNNYYFDGTEKDAAIVHYKSDVRHHWREHE